MSPIWISHATHMNESCHTYEWDMSHIRMSHVTHMNQPWHTYEWVMSHVWMSHVLHVPLLIFIWHDSFMFVSVVRWLIYMCDKQTSDSVHMAWLIHMCNMTYSYVWYDSFMCVTWLTNSNYNRKLPERITSARRDANRIRVDESCHTHERVMSHIQMSHTTRIDEGIPERMTSARRDANANAISPRTWKFELMSHGTRNDESCRTSEWVNSNSNWKEWHLLEVTPMPKRVRHEPESWHTWEWVMPHTWMSHVTHMNGSHHTYNTLL